MKSQDIMNNENNRADAINGLITYCLDNDLSYNYTGKTFTITLPNVEPLPTVTELTPKQYRREKFDIDSWGPKGYVEGEEPDPEQPLDEGEAPRPQL